MKLLSITLLSVILLISCNQTGSRNENYQKEEVNKSTEVGSVLFSDTTFTFENNEIGKIACFPQICHCSLPSTLTIGRNNKAATIISGYS